MTYLKFLSIVLFVSLRPPALTQNIQIQVKQDDFNHIPKSDQRMSIVLDCKNNGDSNLLLYAIGSHLVQNLVTEERVCDLTRVGAGLALMVFNENHERKYPIFRVHDSTLDVPQTEEQLEKLLDQGREQLLDGTRVVKVRGDISVHWNIDLSNFNLKEGRYYFKLIYFSGEGIWKNRIGETQIKQDMKIYNADLYQGCAISNIVHFVIE
ncbi:MAG TPA: hypothetical protein VIN08_16930 [Ohtaekwangia sp.]|uniref:hypothetical protein n=1 Tax=Ohtaekwangia sp. TaxID=2066019 RepID=UPI002F91EAFD